METDSSETGARGLRAPGLKEGADTGTSSVMGGAGGSAAACTVWEKAGRPAHMRAVEMRRLVIG
jgi:hypothetical protein